MQGAAGIDASEIETPFALVDLDRVRANARRTVRSLAAHGLKWRPHVKTHKSRTIARLQVEAGASGLTVATLHEAEAVRSLHGDLLLAHPQVGVAKERRLSAFLEEQSLTIALDSPQALQAARRAAESARRAVGILVEVDVGMGRVGVTEPETLVRLASLARDGAYTFYRGILFYPGHIRSAVAEQGSLVEALSHRLESQLSTLEAAGLSPEIVSGGSTPTLPRSHEVRGMTEVRAGTCIFHDRDSVATGAGSLDDVAYTVFATVVSTPRSGRVILDSGSKSLAREEYRGPPDAAGAGGYGLLPDHPGARIVSLSEEHAIVEAGASGWHPSVGDLVRVIPNHVCVSVNLQDHLFCAVEPHLTPIPIEGRGRHAPALP